MSIGGRLSSFLGARVGAEPSMLDQPPVVVIWERAPHIRLDSHDTLQDLFQVLEIRHITRHGQTRMTRPSIPLLLLSRRRCISSLDLVLRCTLGRSGRG